MYSFHLDKREAPDHEIYSNILQCEITASPISPYRPQQQRHLQRQISSIHWQSGITLNVGTPHYEQLLAFGVVLHLLYISLKF